MRWEISFVPLSCFFFSIFFRAAGPSLVMYWIIGDSWCSNRGFWSLWYEIPAIHNCWRTTRCLWSQIFHVLQRWGVRANPILPQSSRLSHSASLLPKDEMLKATGKSWWKNNICLLQAELLQPFIFVQACYWCWWQRRCWPNVRHQPKFTADITENVVEESGTNLWDYGHGHFLGRALTGLNWCLWLSNRILHHLEVTFHELQKDLTSTILTFYIYKYISKYRKIYLMWRHKKYMHSFLILIPLKLEHSKEQRNKSCRMSFPLHKVIRK